MATKNTRNTKIDPRQGRKRGNWESRKLGNEDPD
jgi:hypothetical protein